LSSTNPPLVPLMFQADGPLQADATRSSHPGESGPACFKPSRPIQADATANAVKVGRARDVSSQRPHPDRCNWG